jgi:hypothetical protein
VIEDRACDLRKQVVEVLRRYSNREDLLKPLVSVLERIKAGDQADMPGVQSVVSADPSRPPVRERLSADDIDQLVRRFCGGTAKRVLVAEYGISLSSVKRLLRRHRQI